MPDDRIKISELSSPLTISDDAKFPISQENGGVQTTFGAEMTQVAVKVGEGTTFSALNLPTGQAKTLVNGINYIIEHGGGGGGASSLVELTDVNITNPTDGQVLAYDSDNEEWVNTTGGGGIPWTDITGTLTAGETTLTISNQAITTSSTIDIYTDVFGVAPTNQVVTSGQIVLTFEAQANNIGVKVRVS